jgi:hypothetical protein
MLKMLKQLHYVLNAQTASYVNPLSQSVQITGSLGVTGSSQLVQQQTLAPLHIGDK